VCIKLVALRMNLYQEVALSIEKVGDPCLSPLLDYTPRLPEACVESQCCCCYAGYPVETRSMQH